MQKVKKGHGYREDNCSPGGRRRQEGRTAAGLWHDAALQGRLPAPASSLRT